MKTAILVSLVTLLTQAAMAKNLSTKDSAQVMELLVRNSTSITLVDQDGQPQPQKNQLPGLIASQLVTGFDDAMAPKTTVIALEQSEVECKALAAAAPGTEEKLCTVTMIDTNFSVAQDGYQLTKLDDASGAWILNVHLIRKTGGAWELKNKTIKAFYAE